MKIYTILEMAKELDTNKERIRQTLNKLHLEAENEKTRTHNNIAKVYSLRSKELVIAELSQDLGVNNAQELQVNAPESQVNAPESQVNAPESQGEIIKLLKLQLEDKDKQLDRAYQEKQDLIRSLSEAQQLVNQQQQLSLQSNKKIGMLELELKEMLQEEIENKQCNNKKWYDVFNRKK